jgi:ABC-type uncharacterized transport system permease subunit
MVEKVSSAGRFFATGSLRRLLLASLTIAAILLGLVGMHALSAGAGAQSGHPAQSQMSSGLDTGTQPMPGSNDSAPPAIASALVAAAAAVSAQGSSDMWAMTCLLVGMVCALILLVALLGLVLSTRPPPRLSAIREVVRISRIVTSKFVLPMTPSPIALSISRT